MKGGRSKIPAPQTETWLSGELGTHMVALEHVGKPFSISPNKCAWMHAVICDTQPHGLQLVRLLCLREFPGKNTGLSPNKKRMRFPPL